MKHLIATASLCVIFSGTAFWYWHQYTASPVNPINNQANAYKILVRSATNGPMPAAELIIRAVNITYTLSEAQ